jgi:hypothetical protein
MAATDASELLARFAAGAAPADVCTPEGRALLRGAVRAYGAAMSEAGETWPAAPARDVDADLSSMDVSVLVAFAAGFVEASDLRGPARASAGELPFAQWPEIQMMRQAASVACADAARLQQAAARFVLEAARYQQLAADAARDARAAARMRVQGARMERAQSQMQLMAAYVEASLEAAQRGG